MMARRPSLAHRVEYLAWRVTVAILSRLPLGAARAIGAAVGRAGYRPLGIRRRVVDHQLGFAFSELDAPARARIASGAYAHLGQLAVESAVLSTRAPNTLVDMFHPPIGWDELDAARSVGRGVILVSGHLGNWEIGLAYIIARGVPLTAVARRMGNPLFDAYVTAARGRLGIPLVAERETVRALPRLLAGSGVVAMLADQGSRGLSSIFTPFFGRLARTPRGPALLALRHRAEVVFMVAPREADGRYRVAFERVPITRTGDRDRDVSTIVEAYTSRLEAWVRKYPEQYLWHHRRWRRRPDGSFENVE